MNTTINRYEFSSVFGVNRDMNNRTHQAAAHMLYLYNEAADRVAKFAAQAVTTAQRVADNPDSYGMDPLRHDADRIHDAILKRDAHREAIQAFQYLISNDNN